MLNILCGFIWGVFCTLFSIDIFSDAIDISWIVYFLVLVVLVVSTAVLQIYLTITDYKTMITDGYNTGNKAISFIIKKYKDKKK